MNEPRRYSEFLACEMAHDGGDVPLRTITVPLDSLAVWFLQGSQLHTPTPDGGRLVGEVVSGLPPTARFVGVDFDPVRRRVIFTVCVPGAIGPATGQAPWDADITVKTHYQPPVAFTPAP
jgi:hypothetical protein